MKLSWIKWLFLAVLFAPFFWRPFLLNLDPDTGLQVMDAVRMADARWSFSLEPSAAYANPVVQMLVDFHGIFRQLVFYPIIYVADLLGIGMTEFNLGAIFVLTSFGLIVLSAFFLQSIVGKKQSWWFVVLLASMPFCVISIKGGWWQIFTFTALLAGLAALHKFLHTSSSKEGERRKRYAWFCVAVAAYMLADTGFIFGLLWYALYILIYFYHHKHSTIIIFGEALKMIWSRWTLLPVVVLLGSIAVTVIGKIKFGADFGIVSRLLEKGPKVDFQGFETIPHLMVQGMGLTGWILFPAMFAALFVLIVRYRSDSPLIRSAVLYCMFAVAALLLTGGGGASVYILYCAGLIILVHAIYKIRASLRYVLLAVLLAATFIQTMLYQFEYQPSGILTKPWSFTDKHSTCQILWCPWHFASQRNLGVTTLGFVMRNYLDYKPIPFVSMEENFHVRPKEIFFYSNYGQGPSFSIGRRLSYEVDDIEEAQVIIFFTSHVEEMTSSFGKTPFEADKNKRVFEFIEDHKEYKHVATITNGGLPVIEVYERDSEYEHRTFSVEEYDDLFNKKYGNLKDLGHIDLG